MSKKLVTEKEYKIAMKDINNARKVNAFYTLCSNKILNKRLNGSKKLELLKLREKVGEAVERLTKVTQDLLEKHAVKQIDGKKYSPQDLVEFDDDVVTCQNCNAVGGKILEDNRTGFAIALDELEENGDSGLEIQKLILTENESSSIVVEDMYHLRDFICFGEEEEDEDDDEEEDNEEKDE